RERMGEARRRANVLPLGSGALAGTNFPVDREWMAERLGFAGVTRNSLDAVIRLHQTRRCDCDRQQPDAAEEKPRLARTGAWEGGARLRPRLRTAHADQRAAARLQQGFAGR